MHTQLYMINGPASTDGHPLRFIKNLEQTMIIHEFDLFLVLSTRERDFEINHIPECELGIRQSIYRVEYSKRPQSSANKGTRQLKESSSRLALYH
jgi:hypothetical protein